MTYQKNERSSFSVLYAAQQFILLSALLENKIDLVIGPCHHFSFKGRFARVIATAIPIEEMTSW